MPSVDGFVLVRAFSPETREPSPDGESDISDMLETVYKDYSNALEVCWERLNPPFFQPN